MRRKGYKVMNETQPIWPCAVVYTYKAAVPCINDGYTKAFLKSYFKNNAWKGNVMPL